MFRLKVQRIEQVCLFELSWGQAQSLTVQLVYPVMLTRLYQEWQQTYLSFYQSSQMRGRAVAEGKASLTMDWHAELVKAEAKLLYEFHRWLRSAELYEIRAKIALASQQLAKQNPEAPEAVSVFLTCSPIELARFPWEAWEIGTEFSNQDLSTTGAVRVIRAPLNIDGEVGRWGDRGSGRSHPRRSRTRILAILGDDTGLNFQADREAVRSLLKIADVTFLGWQPNQTPAQVMQQISAAIEDEQGWDVLFFAGHSNETDMTGGELGIAPGVSMSISEITPQLIAAKQRGLQVAIFNSCSGLSIADALINIGFSQVVVMREPIHNQVAQTFLVRFLQRLAKHQDVQESLLNARQFLRLEKNQTYPSAYLVPSLFCHPEAPIFRIPPFRWKERLLQVLPTKGEAIALAALAVLSFIPPLQEGLTAGRMMLQSAYWDATGQLPSEGTPPVALIQIDTKSINQAALEQITPIDRRYLGDLVTRLKELNAEVVGIDVTLDVPQETPPDGDETLAKAVRESVAEQNTWFLFAAFLNESAEMGVDVRTGIADPDWSLQGFTDADLANTVVLPFRGVSCDRLCPFSYLLSLVQTARQELPASTLPQPQLNRTRSLRSDLLTSIYSQNPQDSPLAALMKTQLSPISMWSPWLTPLIDFSIPPEQVYQKIPAWKLLDVSNPAAFAQLPQQVVLIAGGDDPRLGFSPGELDRSPMPLAAQYWEPNQLWLTGGESLAFMVHHFLNQRMITPVPDVWMMAIAALFGKITLGFVKRQQPHGSRKQRVQVLAGLTGATALYGAASVQLYVTAALLLPVLLPTAVFWIYLFPVLRRKSHG
jgi:hypothetical protein